jgi:glycosyltransferase involved in cell wall biosynthesis
MQDPTISIVIPTLNAADDLVHCLEAIEAQDYPAERVEVLVLDGGSTDSTVEIAEGHGCRVIRHDDPAHHGTYLGLAEPRMAIGVTLAQNDIVALIMSDNWMPTDQWLRQMTQPLMEDTAIVGTLTLRYGYRADGDWLERYLALIGTSDPAALYLNKRDRISWSEDAPSYNGTVEDRGAYYRVRFRSEGLPPLGCNGTLVRREMLLKCDTAPERFTHSEAMQELVDLGHNTFGVVKNDITHVFRGSWANEVRKRMGFFRLYAEDRPPRRYHLFDWHRPSDLGRLLLYVLYSVTFVKPTYDAVHGFRKRRDSAWFAHPFYCFVMTFAYGFSVASLLIRGRAKKGSQQ